MAKDSTQAPRARFSRRDLTPDEVAQIASLQDMGDAMLAKLHEIGGTDPKTDAMASTRLAQAASMIDLGVKAAIAHING